MAEQRVIGGDHEIGIGTLVEVPAVAVTLGLDDADLLQFLQRPVAGLHIRVPRADRRPAAERPGRRIVHLADSVVFQTQLGQSQIGVVVTLHELREVGTAAEVVADATDHDDLDVVVDGRRAQQVGIPQPRHGRRRVQILGTVEGDRRDLGLGVLLVEDELFGGRSIAVLGHELSFS
jgi:hypothetical protein